MRGYLSHIAARVTGTRPVVRPRVPSRYEPVKGSQVPNIPGLVTERNGVQARESLEQERFVDAAPPAPARASQEPVRQRQSDRADAPSRDAENSQAESSRRDAVRSEERPRPVAARVTAAPVDGEIEASSMEAAASMPVRPQPVAISREREADKPMPVSIEAREQQPRDVRTTRIEVERVEREVMRIVRGRDEREPGNEGIRPVAARDERRQEVAPVAVSSIAPVNLPAARERTVPARESISESAPSVQVTIGRLIVEAVMPPSAPAPAPIRSAPGPRLSLDDYLRQRGGRA